MDGPRNQQQATQIRPADEQMYAAHAAAALLGIHRSTLYLAVRKMKLIPDAYTPGGHARFRRETLERFRDRLALDSATGGDTNVVRAVARAVAALSRFTKLQPVCEAVVEAALAVCPGFECGIVVARDEHARPGRDLQLLAERGLSQRMGAEYRFLRRRMDIDFITAMVARQKTPFYCADMLAESAQVPEGGFRVIARGGGFRSCAVLPCIYDDVTLGILICLGRAPTSVSEPEVVALSSLADILTAALRRHRRDEVTLRQTAAIDELARLARLAQGGAAPHDGFSEVRRICQQGGGARMVREWGFGADAVDAPAPLAELLRAAAVTDAPQRAEWSECACARVALAVPAHAQGSHAAVGAIWLKRDLRTGMEAALLQVYAQACSCIASRLS